MLILIIFYADGGLIYCITMCFVHTYLNVYFIYCIFYEILGCSVTTAVLLELFKDHITSKQKLKVHFNVILQIA